MLTRRSDNLRYNVSPVAIAYPSTPQQVSAVVQAGGSQGLAVTARSGGVRVFFPVCRLWFLTRPTA